MPDHPYEMWDGGGPGASVNLDDGDRLPRLAMALSAAMVTSSSKPECRSVRLDGER